MTDEQRVEALGEWLFSVWDNYNRGYDPASKNVCRVLARALIDAGAFWVPHFAKTFEPEGRHLRKIGVNGNLHYLIPVKQGKKMLANAKAVGVME
jgi:hypothetical protein